MKKLLSSIFAITLFLGLSGCGSSRGETEPEQNNDPQELVIEESGYHLSSDTSPYIMYSVKVTNPNEDYYVNSAAINVTAYDAEGNILASTPQSWGPIAPGESVYFAGQADCNQVAPANVEFEVTNTKDDYSENPDREALTELEVSNTNIMQDQFSSSVTGVVKNTMDEDIGGSWVSVIFYKEGAMIGGKFTFTEGISSGGEMPFDISIYQMPEGYDDYKVYAYNWF